VLIIDGLQVARKISDGFALKPKNVQILNQIVNEQSIDFGLQVVKPNNKVYRFKIKRLPTLINPEKTRFKVSFYIFH
jgi:hypothetical protein